MGKIEVSADDTNGIGVALTDESYEFRSVRDRVICHTVTHRAFFPDVQASQEVCSRIRGRNNVTIWFVLLYSEEISFQFLVKSFLFLEFRGGERELIFSGLQ
jgi:hypothetical protein